MAIYGASVGPCGSPGASERARDSSASADNVRESQKDLTEAHGPVGGRRCGRLAMVYFFFLNKI